MVKEVGDSCKTIEKVDFVKIDSYTTLTKNIGSCIHKAGRKCNSQLQKVIQECKKNNRGLHITNFLNEDYPNHPGPNKTTNVEIALQENLKFLDELFDVSGMSVMNSHTISNNWGINETDTNEESDPEYEDYENDYDCITTSETPTQHSGLDAIGSRPSCQLNTVFTKQSGKK